MKYILCLLLTAISAIAAFTQEPKVTWFDDFLGINVNPIYAVNCGGTGRVGIAPVRGGVLQLYALSAAPGVARVRLGEEPGNSAFNAINFSARKNLTYKARVFLNSAENIQATVGLTGLNDPHNVLALIYQRPNSGRGWLFQVTNEGHNLTVPLGFFHTPGKYFTVKIETEWGEGFGAARAYINDELKATVDAEFIPNGLVAEFQVWNVKTEDGAHSQPTMYVDYLSITQDR